MKLISYKHYPTDKAFDEMEQAEQGQRYKITTINGTHATIRGKQDGRFIHKNQYETGLVELIQWIRDTDEVAEDIINIERI